MKTISVTDFTDDPGIQELQDELIESCAGKQFSDLVDDQGHQYIDLVMEGGGVLGIGLVGYTYVLETVGLRFLGVGGTSAGAINALLVAALGTPVERKSLKMVELLANTNLRSFADGDDDAQELIEAFTTDTKPLTKARRFVDALDELYDLTKHLGLNPGKVFHKWLSDTLADVGITTTAQLQERMETLPDGLRIRGQAETLSKEEAASRLAVVAADISTETKVEFPRMAPMYYSDPENVNPADYVRASMAIPLFFQPFRIKGIPQGSGAEDTWAKLASYKGQIPETSTFVDGGIMSNFPIDLFHQPNSVPVAPTFGAKLSRRERQPHRIGKVGSLAGALFSAMSHTLDYDFIARHPDYQRLVAWINPGHHHWLNFDMDPKDKIDLFARGMRAARDFLACFDWEQYKELRAQLSEACKMAEDGEQTKGTGVKTA
jgi:NTE family protein